MRDLFPSVYHSWSNRMLLAPFFFFFFFTQKQVGPVDCLMQIYFVRVGLARIQSDRFENVSNDQAKQMDRLGRINTCSKEVVRGH